MWEDADSVGEMSAGQMVVRTSMREDRGKRPSEDRDGDIERQRQTERERMR